MPLEYLLDTNICIYITKQKPDSMFEKFQSLNVGTIGMSIITYGELYYGVQKSAAPKKNNLLLAELIKLIPVLTMPIDAGVCYGKIRSTLEKKGKIIGNNDLWIAAHAIALGLTIITNNQKEFSHVSGLAVENWV